MARFVGMVRFVWLDRFVLPKGPNMCRSKNCDDKQVYEDKTRYEYYINLRHDSYSPQMIPTDPSSSWTVVIRYNSSKSS